MMNTIQPCSKDQTHNPILLHERFAALFPTRKPRTDSPLNRLPPERQAQLLLFLQTHSLRQARLQLAAEGVQTSKSALSAYRLRRQACTIPSVFQTVEQLQATVSGIASALRTPLAISDPELWAYAERLLIVSAI